MAELQTRFSPHSSPSSTNGGGGITVLEEKDDTNNRKGSSGSSSSFKVRALCGILFLTVFGVMIFFKEDILLTQDGGMMGKDVLDSILYGNRGTSGGGKKKRKSKKECNSICTEYSEQFFNKWIYDKNSTTTTQEWTKPIPDFNILLKRAMSAKEDVITKLKKQYSEEYYYKIFEPKPQDDDGNEIKDAPRESIGITAFQGSDEKMGHDSISRKRFIRKVQLKLLEAQINMKNELQNVQDGSCDCSSSAGSSSPIQRKGSSAATRESKHHKDRMLLRNLQEEEEDQQEQADESDTTTTTTSTSTDELVKEHYSKFVWANGGHSSAAGHGNMFNETYTSIMEQTASMVYDKVGIRLIGRNHGMGGMASSPELALCNEAVYGTDADLISWNFGMTDGNSGWRHLFYSTKRGTHVNKPIIFDMVMGADGSKHSGGYDARMIILKDLEKYGLSTIQMKSHVFYSNCDTSLKDIIPETKGLNQDQINDIPINLRNFKCDDKLEEGDPFCGGEKYTPYNQSQCHTPHQAPWHPGWKSNALSGNMIAMFMIDILIDALVELKQLQSDLSSSDDNSSFNLEQTLYDNKKRQEDDDYKMYNSKTSIPQDYLPDSILHPSKEHAYINENVSKWFNTSHLFREKSICRTGFLPSMSRYLNIGTYDYLSDKEKSISLEEQKLAHDELTKHQATLSQRPKRNYYELGIPRIVTKDKDEVNITSSSDIMPLVYDYPKEGNDCIKEPLIDFKDYFFIQYENQGNDGKILKIPNDMERQEYLSEKQQQHKFKGMVVICFKGCPWGKCNTKDAAKFLQSAAYKGLPNSTYRNDTTTKDGIVDDNKPFDITINNKKVIQTTYIESACSLLATENTDSSEDNDFTYYTKPLKDRKQNEYYEIKVKLYKPDTYMSITSIIVI